ncbi:hypothetical protein D3C76_1769700 [compost metagenome]
MGQQLPGNIPQTPLSSRINAVDGSGLALAQNVVVSPHGVTHIQKVPQHMP